MCVWMDPSEVNLFFYLTVFKIEKKATPRSPDLPTATLLRCQKHMTSNLSLSHNSEDAEGFTLEGSWIVLKLFLGGLSVSSSVIYLRVGLQTVFIAHQL